MPGRAPRPRSGCPGEPGVDVLGRERGIFELVEDAELFFEQEGSVDGRLACWTSPSEAERSSCNTTRWNSTAKIMAHIPRK